MGCTSSRGANYDPNAPIDPRMLDGKPDALRREITEIFRVYCEHREHLRPLTAEKAGLNAMIAEERGRLLELIAKVDTLKAQREPLLKYTWEKDADDLYRAFSKYSADKSVLIGILATRTKWQLDLISEAYERKYREPLIMKVVNDLTTMMGKIMTGSQTGLSKLLTYRLMPQPERDAAFLRDFSDGITSLDDENLIEIVCTRRNHELRAAVDCYFDTYGRDLPDIVRKKASYNNYRNFLLKVLECNRDESNKSFDDVTAQKYADELYAAGGGRTIGFDPEPFIRILGTISKAQFDSINDKYKDHALLRDISSKLGGDFANVVVTMCSDKFEYLAGRLQETMKSADKEGICRILGCLSRWECARVREAFDRGVQYGRTLEQALKTVLKGHYLLACMTLISGDASSNPLGSDKEEGEDEAEAERDGDRARKMAEVNYHPGKIMEYGDRSLREQRYQRGRGGGNGENGDDDSPDGEGEYQNFYWDSVKGRFLDPGRLMAVFEDGRDALMSIQQYRGRIVDEIIGIRDVYFALVKHCYETDAWIRILSNQVKNLTDFVARRDKAAGGVPPPSGLGLGLSTRGSGNNTYNTPSSSNKSGGSYGPPQAPPTNNGGGGNNNTVNGYANNGGNKNNGNGYANGYSGRQ